jgi:hypothetical protein
MSGETLNQQLETLKPNAIDDFSRSCLEAARRALEDGESPLRFNFFSTAMRILFEHMMDTLARMGGACNDRRCKGVTEA